MARVKLIQEKSDLPSRYHDVFDELASLRGRISGPSSVVLHSPELAHPWNGISEFLHRSSIVEPEYAELGVCTSARAWDCGYVWSAHVPAALQAGVSQDAIDAIASFRDPSDLTTGQLDVVRYARQLARDRRVDQQTFDALLQAHGARWLVELTGWIGRYSALSCILNTFDVEAPPDRAALPATPPVAASKTPSAPHGPRIKLLTDRSEVDPTEGTIFDAVAASRGNVRGPFALLMYSPPLCEAVLGLTVYLRLDSQIPARTRELAVIATARERDCPYVWAAHAPAARKEGVAEETIAAVRDRGVIEPGSPEADVVELVRSLMRAHRVDQALFDRLIATHTLPGLVELCAVIGHYLCVTTLLNAFEVPPAAGAEALPLV